LLIFFKGYHSEGFLFLQRTVDYLLLEMMFAKERASKNADLELPIRYKAIDKVHPMLQRFPHPLYQHANFVQMVTEQLATFLVLTYMPIFVFNTWLLVKERQAGAKVSDMVMVVIYEVYLIVTYTPMIYLPQNPLFRATYRTTTLVLGTVGSPGFCTK